MNKTVFWLGFIILIVGIGLIYYSVEIMIPQYEPVHNIWLEERVRVYPHRVAGYIVTLIGFVTLVIGGSMKNEREESVYFHS